MATVARGERKDFNSVERVNLSVPREISDHTFVGPTKNRRGPSSPGNFPPSLLISRNSFKLRTLKLFLMIVLTCLFIYGVVPAKAATVMTDEQISEIATTAEAGGDVTALASEYMEAVTADLVAQGLTGDELQAQISVAIQELTSGLGNVVLPNLEARLPRLIQLWARVANIAPRVARVVARVTRAIR